MTSADEDAALRCDAAIRTSVTPRLNEDDIVDVIAVTAVQAAAARGHT